MTTEILEDSIQAVDDSDRSRSTNDAQKLRLKQLAVYLILASTLCERLAFYSLSSNLVSYPTNTPALKWTPESSVATLNIFYGTSYVSALLFAIISDAKLGRGLTISIGFFLYLSGYIFFTITVYDYTFPSSINNDNATNSTSPFEQNHSLTVLSALIITALGAGAVQTNIAVFGAEQTRELGTTSRFFDKYMIAVNIGGMIATLVTLLTQRFIQDSYYYFTAYLVSVIMLGSSGLFLIFGLRYYTHVKPYDTIITKCIPITVDAFRLWRERKKYQRSTEDAIEEQYSQQSIGFFDFAKTIHHGRFQEGIVDDVKSLRSAFVVFILLIPYWIVYNQRDATFPLQGQNMYSSNGQGATWVSLTEQIVIIIGLSALNLFGYKYIDRYNIKISMPTKFIIGMSLGCFTMCTAGVVEIIRLADCGSTQNTTTMSVLYQLPQYASIGLSEIFLVVGSYEYAYFCAPRSAQALFMSLRFCSSGLSSFISVAFLYAFPTTNIHIDFTCRSKDDSGWSFYTYFFVLGGILLISMVVTIICQRRFKIIKLNKEKLQYTHSSSTFVN